MSSFVMPYKLCSRLPEAQVALRGYLFAALAIVILFQIELAFSKSINWDEFYHFSEITEFNAGRPTEFFQTPYVKLFWWIPQLGGDNILQIQLIRLLTLAFELIAVAAIVAMSRRLVDQNDALVSGVAFASGGFVFLHAFALRSDMIASAFLMISLYICMTGLLRFTTLCMAVVFGALGFLCTIKAVLYAPAFLGVAYYRLDHRHHRMVLVTLTSLAMLAGCVFLMVGPSLPSTGYFKLAHDASLLGRTSIDWMFTQEFFPQKGWALQQAIQAPLLTGGLIMTAISACRKKTFDRLTVLRIGFLGPLLTVPFYYNAYPYHYAFILPPAVVAIAPEFGVMLRRYGYLFITLVLVANAAVLSLTQDRAVIERQRTIQSGLREIFPQPVAYIDNCGLAGDFPRAVNKFATAWALRDYRRKGIPSYSNAMLQEVVPLLLVDSPTLLEAVKGDAGPEGLRASDVAIIQSNYILHWGSAYVAGKNIPAGSQNRLLQFAVPGPYTVERASIRIDGLQYAPGDVVSITRGLHRVDSTGAVTLRWGDHLRMPTQPWPLEAYFTIY